jgi:hypothetical protein
MVSEWLELFSLNNRTIFLNVLGVDWSKRNKGSSSKGNYFLNGKNLIRQMLVQLKGNFILRLIIRKNNSLNPYNSIIQKKYLNVRKTVRNLRSRSRDPMCKTSLHQYTTLSIDRDLAREKWYRNAKYWIRIHFKFIYTRITQRQPVGICRYQSTKSDTFSLNS